MVRTEFKLKIKIKNVAEHTTFFSKEIIQCLFINPVTVIFTDFFAQSHWTCKMKGERVVKI